jgi:hypothetical protein
MWVASPKSLCLRPVLAALIGINPSSLILGVSFVFKCQFLPNIRNRNQLLQQIFCLSLVNPDNAIDLDPVGRG